MFIAVSLENETLNVHLNYIIYIYKYTSHMCNITFLTRLSHISIWIFKGVVRDPVSQKNIFL